MAGRISMAVLVLAAWVVGGCAREERFEFTRLCMGVPTRVVLYAETRGAAEEAARRAYARIGEIEDALSDYRAGSETNRVNAEAGGEAVRVGPDLIAVLERALEIARATDGAFDPTMGPAVALWRRVRAGGPEPTHAETGTARALVDWGSVEVDADARTVRLARAGMRLDFGGIGKGYASSEAVRVLRDGGYHRCMVALAGDVSAWDSPPGMPGWRVAVGPAGGSIGGSIWLRRASVSSSGDAEQAVGEGANRRGHIIDPRTGEGSGRRGWVTVVAATGAEADALATAVFLLGDDPRAEAALRQFGAGAWIAEATPGGWRERQVGQPLVWVEGREEGAAGPGFAGGGGDR